MLLQATKAAASLPDLTKDEANADVAPMDEDMEYDALEAEAEAELAALAAEAASAAQGAGNRSEDAGIVMLPVGHSPLRCQPVLWVCLQIVASIVCYLKMRHGHNIRKWTIALTRVHVGATWLV